MVETNIVQDFDRLDSLEIMDSDFEDETKQENQQLKDEIAELKISLEWLEEKAQSLNKLKEDEAKNVEHIQLLIDAQKDTKDSLIELDAIVRN